MGTQHVRMKGLHRAELVEKEVGETRGRVSVEYLLSPGNGDGDATPTPVSENPPVPLPLPPPHAHPEGLKIPG